MEIQQHEYFMQMAIGLATANVRQNSGGPFGAVIVRDSSIVAQSANLVTATNDPTAHAEISAIRLACNTLGTFDLRGCVIYTSCEPCPMCLSAIYWAHIDKIYYANTKVDAANIGFDDNFIYDELAKPLDQRKIPVKQLLRDDAQLTFKLWESASSKTNY